MKRTFWLYHGSRVLTAVRMSADAIDQEIVRHAIENEDRCPIGHGPYETPVEFRNRLRRATVRVFATDGPTAEEAPQRHARVPAADLGDTLDAGRHVRPNRDYLHDDLLRAARNCVSGRTLLAGSHRVMGELIAEVENLRVKAHEGDASVFESNHRNLIEGIQETQAARLEFIQRVAGLTRIDHYQDGEQAWDTIQELVADAQQLLNADGTASGGERSED